MQLEELEYELQVYKDSVKSHDDALKANLIMQTHTNLKPDDTGVPVLSCSPQAFSEPDPSNPTPKEFQKQHNKEIRMATEELNRSHQEIAELKAQLDNATLNDGKQSTAEKTVLSGRAAGEPVVNNEVSDKLDIAEEKLTASVRRAKAMFLLKVRVSSTVA